MKNNKAIIIPLTGVCNRCRAIKPFDCPTTHIHHEKYHEGSPLKDTIELCIICHGKAHKGRNKGKVAWSSGKVKHKVMIYLSDELNEGIRKYSQNKFGTRDRFRSFTIERAIKFFLESEGIKVGEEKEET